MQITYANAILNAQNKLLENYEDVVLIGINLHSPSGVFGSCKNLLEKFGPERIIESPASENGISNIALGMAISGMKPVVIHHRADFAILAMDSMVNQAAKFRFMYGDAHLTPVTYRMIVGRGWGQGPQHSQSIHTWLSHTPGIKVYLPITPNDAYHLTISAVLDPSPVALIEHRWLFDILGEIDFENEKSIDTRVVQVGKDITLVGISFMAIENRKAAEMLLQIGISTTIIDLVSVSPINIDPIIDSLKVTKKIIISDIGHDSFGVGSEVLKQVLFHGFSDFDSPPLTIGLPNYPTPTAPSLSSKYYPRAIDIAKAAAEMCGANPSKLQDLDDFHALDVPNKDFMGPY